MSDLITYYVKGTWTNGSHFPHTKRYAIQALDISTALSVALRVAREELNRLGCLAVCLRMQAQETEPSDKMFYDEVCPC